MLFDPKNEFVDATTDEANQVAEVVGDLLARMVVNGASPVAVLAGAHGQIVALMAVAFGGRLAADRCENAANRVRDLPSAAAMYLADATPAGRA